MQCFNTKSIVKKKGSVKKVSSPRIQSTEIYYVDTSNVVFNGDSKHIHIYRWIDGTQIEVGQDGGSDKRTKGNKEKQ